MSRHNAHDAEVATAFYATRARDLIVAACADACPRTVLLPALYCGEMVDAIEAAGMQWQCYDLTADLTPDLDRQVLDRLAGPLCLIWCHPFGLSRTLPEAIRSSGATLIEDACHALRSRIGTDQWEPGVVTVVSPRKELGWPNGGVAFGVGSRPSSYPPEACDVRDRWRRLDLESAVAAGRAATRTAYAALGSYLPRIAADDVLTYLPLLSWCPQRDVMELRANGIEAWRWLDSPCVRRPQDSPVASLVWRRLMLVPLPSWIEANRQWDLLRSRAWISWENWDQCGN
jgi:hypothetical protein